MALNPRLPGFWHGGDYNPEQWPEATWDEDARLMEETRFRVATLGVFSWAALEPEEGRFEFDWLDRVIEKLSAADRYFILATPSAAPPAWMSRRYSEILRTGSDRVRRHHGNRVNYSLFSPVYREKCADVARRLAERYGHHPRLLAWHVSNEYGGEDFAPGAIAAFREWLKTRYGSLDRLNAAYWTAFWSHTYGDWDEIDAPGEPYGETAIQGLTVDWRRFTTDATVGFMLNEAAPLREISPDVPLTTNFMGTYPGLDYRRFAPHLDFACWDSYPGFGGALTDTGTWVAVAFKHDLTRGLNREGRWMVMEISPSSSNWYPTMTLKRPGMHRFEALQAIAHGADGVQYFQWRQSRGSQEQLHGAVVGHGTTANGRVFGEVRAVGEELESLEKLAGSRVEAEVAIVYDWEARWMLEAACGPVQGEKGYEQTAIDHYRPFWEAGIPVDVIGPNDDLSKYKILLAPMLYSLTSGFAERIEAFVEAGGAFVATYLTGWVDESGLVFEEGLVGPLRRVLGLWSEEIDALPAGEANGVHLLSAFRPETSTKGSGGAENYRCERFCELVHPTTAKTLATFERDFYAGRPALTVNRLGTGRAYYVASRNEASFTNDFLRGIASEAGVEPVVAALPQGVTAQRRIGRDREYILLMNATPTSQAVSTAEWGEVALPAWGVAVRERPLGAA